MKKSGLFIAMLLLFAFSTSCKTAQKAVAAKTESEKTSKKKSKFKPYSKVVTSDAVTDDGLFKTHQVEDDFFYEIPNDMLEKDMLWVTRIAQIPSNLGGGYMNAGSKTNQQVVAWERFQNKILLKVKSFSEVALDSTAAISNSVKVNNYEPIMYAFDIVAFSADSTAVVINVTKFLSTDVPSISGLSSRLRKQYKVRSLDKERSFINSVKSFPENIEVKQDFTYTAAEPPSNSSVGSISMQVNQSMILLPEVPMQPRLFDPRVGFFTVDQIDYSSKALKADEKTYIRRWRLEPKDPEAYARGELVEPIKPIVYYLDPGTPENLKEYIKQGIEDWQKPFETAGFKNAIIARDAPTPEEDPEFSPEDIRYSVVRYVASTTRNAVGPSVSDPRSGEIIESDIIWYHNHLRSYRNRYLLETGAANPSARTLDTDTKEMGEMMRQVIAHEIGHALGFPHNMAASYAYDVEDYRNGAFTQENGIAASLMDYARYNYIAQPGDENIRFVRQMGPYDHYATNWGYRVIPEATSPEDEVATLNSWIMEKAGDPVYKFGRQSSRFDPQSQTEAIGNNPIKASTYGMKNLKYVAQNLSQWTSSQTDNYDDLQELYGELLGVYSRYAGHVVTNVGGVNEDLKKPSQSGTVYSTVDKKTQQESVQWIIKNVFETPSWLVDKNIVQNIGPEGYFDRLRSIQARQLNSLLSFDRIGRLINSETVDANYYTALEMLQDVRKGIFSKSTTDIYRRNLQRVYIDRLSYLMTEDSSRSSYNIAQSDVRALVRGELNTLQSTLRSKRNSASNQVNKYHYEDLLARVDLILNPR
ncbi:zinc-dependent metalloprotease [Nonlabens arenilitoris]|uniref:Zinc-dependent metalloprotease n=1 Tax=Nonlabens arenilitoris TaxID=1217969 RepID=A0A2S7UCC6_9FLAO|nr:zinc-dependent metalloprotease [Nonlabens arenilitoris]PQJ32529.1 zinc-dependent metalloprotease [Nonlabens arenilitoris]